MAFLGWATGVQDKLNSWHLPDRIKRCLLLSMMPLVDAPEPTELPQDGDGMFFYIDFPDPENEEHHFYFTLRITRNDTDFRVSDLTGSEFDGDDHMVWHSDGGSP